MKCTVIILRSKGDIYKSAKEHSRMQFVLQAR